MGGPHDHITGDKDFALHGNPDGVQHSMVCPQPEQKLDCYFDKECHAKVDWEKISEIKGGFFARLKVYKERGDVAAVREMMSTVHEMFRRSETCTAETGEPTGSVEEGLFLAALPPQSGVSTCGLVAAVYIADRLCSDIAVFHRCVWACCVRAYRLCTQ